MLLLKHHSGMKILLYCHAISLDDAVLSGLQKKYVSIFYFVVYKATDISS